MFKAKLVEFLELQNQDILNQMQVIREHDLPLKETYFQQGRSDMLQRIINFMQNDLGINDENQKEEVKQHENCI